MEGYYIGIETCNQRIASLEDQMENYRLRDRELHMGHLKNTIELLKIERLIYQSLKKKGNATLFPKLLSKYDELLNKSLEYINELVSNGNENENTYLQYCKGALEQRQFIEECCLAGWIAEECCLDGWTVVECRWKRA
jgi:hypothetical protein